MFRYRCPHCSQLLQALEMRAGKTTVCSKCSQPLTIPGNPVLAAAPSFVGTTGQGVVATADGRLIGFDLADFSASVRTVFTPATASGTFVPCAGTCD